MTRENVFARARPAAHLLEALRLVPIGIEHVDQIADLHYKELFWSFNGQLGRDHIRSLYSTLVRNPHFFGHIIYLKEKPVGFATATTSWRAIRNEVKHVYRGKRLAVLWFLLRNPMAAVGIVESLIVIPFVFTRLGASAEWLTFVTDTDASFVAPLAALRLIDAVRDEYRLRGVDLYVAQGVRNNPRAMQLYAKLGWSVAARLPVHNIYIYRSDARDASSVIEVQSR